MCPLDTCAYWDCKVQQAGKSHIGLCHLDPWREWYSEQMDCTVQKEWVAKSALPCTCAVNFPIGAGMCVGVCVFM